MGVSHASYGNYPVNRGDKSRTPWTSTDFFPWKFHIEFIPLQKNYQQITFISNKKKLVLSENEEWFFNVKSNDWGKQKMSRRQHQGDFTSKPGENPNKATMTEDNTEVNDNYMSFRKQIDQYLHDASLHGLRFIGNRKITWFERFVWSFSRILFFLFKFPPKYFCPIDSSSYVRWHWLSIYRQHSFKSSGFSGPHQQ